MIGGFENYTLETAETRNSSVRGTTKGDHEGRARAGYGFRIRETTKGDHERATDLGPGRPQGETTRGDHGQRIQDPGMYPPALEGIYRVLKLYQLFRI